MSRCRSQPRPTRAQRPVHTPLKHAEAIAFAWRVHGAQESWTAKVDIKASIVLALDGVVLAAVITGHNKGGVFSQLEGWRNIFQGVAGGLILLGLALAGAVVRPALGSSREHKLVHRNHLIYFGHLRHWKGQPENFAAHLRAWTPEDETEQLAEQLLNMSQRNWWKHRLLQLALYTSGVAAILLVLTALWPH